jgi:hypothetical protein
VQSPLVSSVVKLTVEPASANLWFWSVLTGDSLTLIHGQRDTKQSAQIACQVAFEDRLHRAGLQREVPAEYHWKSDFWRG